MNQIAAIALGGAFGAVLRFLITSGVYQWLGRGFPYGTLAVNIIGSLLIGLMTEALILQKIALSAEYRAAILIGLFGSLTTFSTFSLDTFYLIEQGQLAKASVNIIVSIVVCLLAVWIGLSLGKILFSHSKGVIDWMGWVIPYALLMVNFIGAFLIGIISTLLLSKSSLSVEHGTALVMVFVGVFITLSSLYLVYYFIEYGYSFVIDIKSIAVTLIANIFMTGLALFIGFWIARSV